MTKEIAIIGGGAAGFFAAIQAARRHPDASVHILEASRKPLAKVLISGGGRCNVTNDTQDTRELLKGYPRGFRELRGAFSRFSVPDTIEWFEAQGVELKTEPDGRMFPTTDDSQTIADCLIESAKAHNVHIETGQRVITIQHANNQFQVTCKGSPLRLFNTVILATGGSKAGFQLAGSLGHEIISPVPSLFTFEVSDPLLKDLSGVSFPEVQLELNADGQSFRREGPLLITHWGLSGPAVIQLSAFAARELFDAQYSAELTISFLPGHTTEHALELLLESKRVAGKKQLRLASPFNFPKRFWERVIECAQINSDKRVADCSKKDLRAVAELLTQKTFTISGKGVFKEEFVTCGGVALREVDFKTMQSKLLPGLYFAGEILDVDGITGGFNFQSAWTTGWIAGQNC